MFGIGGFSLILRQETSFWTLDLPLSAWKLAPVFGKPWNRVGWNHQEDMMLVHMLGLERQIQVSTSLAAKLVGWHHGLVGVVPAIPWRIDRIMVERSERSVHSQSIEPQCHTSSQYSEEWRCFTRDVRVAGTTCYHATAIREPSLPSYSDLMQRFWVPQFFLSKKKLCSPCGGMKKNWV